MIAVKHLCKKYGPVTALEKITFDIRPKEVVGFLGPNGAGKSTAMKILTGVLAPTSGEVRIDGLDVFTNSLAIRKRIGYLPENNPLYFDMRVESFLRTTGKLRGMSDKDLNIRLEKALAVTGTLDVARKFIGTLSKGYRQRVGLAQALLPDPDILILDEPTVGLDPKQIIEIRELIKKVGKEKTVILCSHILPEVQATCSRMIIINHGKIVANGSPDELAAQTGGISVYQLIVHGPKDKVTESLKSVSCITEIDVSDTKQKLVHIYRATCAADADPRADLFNAIVNGGWTMLELSHHSTSLEDVFLNLTTDES